MERQTNNSGLVSNMYIWKDKQNQDKALSWNQRQENQNAYYTKTLRWISSKVTPADASRTCASFRCHMNSTVTCIAQMSPNTSTALFTFPTDLGGLQIKLPRAIVCSAMWVHLTRCCQFDDGTRQLAEITYKDALEKYGCLDMEDLQYGAEFLTWDQASQNSFTFACHLTSTIGIRVSWDPFNPAW